MFEDDFCQPQTAVKVESRVFDVVFFEGVSESIHIEGGVVCHYIITTEEVIDFRPNAFKRGRVLSHLRGDAVDVDIHRMVEVVLWLN